MGPRRSPLPGTLSLAATLLVGVLLGLGVGCSSRSKDTTVPPATGASAAPLAEGPVEAGAAEAAAPVASVQLPALVTPLKPPPTPKDLKKPPPEARKTYSGISYLGLVSGASEAMPTPDDTIVAHYAGWTTDGKLYDSTYARGEPSTFKVGNVIAGWAEGLTLMRVGDRMRFWIPAKLAYGDHPSKGIPAGMLILEVELLEIKGK